MIRTPQWKYIHRYPYGPHELYDLATDPDENNNLINDGGAGEIVAEMRYQLEAWFLRFATLERDGARQPVTGKGQIERVGVAGQGQPAFANDWHYIDAEERPR
jgi:hypothetical protein